MSAAFVEKRLSPTMASRFKGNNTSNSSLNNVVVLAATVHSLETFGGYIEEEDEVGAQQRVLTRSRNKNKKKRLIYYFHLRRFRVLVQDTTVDRVGLGSRLYCQFFQLYFSNPTFRWQSKLRFLDCLGCFQCTTLAAIDMLFLPFFG